jgi:hypothetical protein
MRSEWMMTRLLFDLPEKLTLTVRPDEVSFTAFLPELPAHVRFHAPLLVGRRLLEAFEQDFLDARLQVAGAFGSNNTFTISVWETLPLP